MLVAATVGWVSIHSCGSQMENDPLRQQKSCWSIYGAGLLNGMDDFLDVIMISCLRCHIYSVCIAWLWKRGIDFHNIFPSYFNIQNVKGKLLLCGWKELAQSEKWICDVKTQLSQNDSSQAKLHPNPTTPKKAEQEAVNYCPHSSKEPGCRCLAWLCSLTPYNVLSIPTSTTWPEPPPPASRLLHQADPPTPPGLELRGGKRSPRMSNRRRCRKIQESR